MRDPKRIDPLLEELRKYWKNNPDLRLGQIISNTARIAGHSDPFFIEDGDMLLTLQACNALDRHEKAK